MNITELELRMIDEIAHSDYSYLNGATPNSKEDIGWVWNPVETAQDKGVMTSLIKKGLVLHQVYDANETIVTLTDAGFAVFQNNRG